MSRQGPFQFARSEGIPGQSERDGIWSIAWADGRMIFSGWEAGVKWMEQRFLSGLCASDAIVLAGPFGCPWLLVFYLEAAHAALKGEREKVFDSYAKSATMLLEENKSYHDDLVKPWKNADASS